MLTVSAVVVRRVTRSVKCIELLRLSFNHAVDLSLHTMASAEHDTEGGDSDGSLSWEDFFGKSAIPG